MITTVIVLGLGSVLGGALGFKLGRVYERIRDGKDDKKSKPERKASTSR
jgi:membrane protein YqaA with SNARE-associated domain